MGEGLRGVGLRFFMAASIAIAKLYVSLVSKGGASAPAVVAHRYCRRCMGTHATERRGRIGVLESRSRSNGWTSMCVWAERLSYFARFVLCAVRVAGRGEQWREGGGGAGGPVGLSRGKTYLLRIL